MHEIPDITRNGYIFTDGCGDISSDFADQIAKMLDLESTPSAFQVTNLPCYHKSTFSINLKYDIQFEENFENYKSTKLKLFFQVEKKNYKIIELFPNRKISKKLCVT
jgi:hypothetical protein